MQSQQPILVTGGARFIESNFVFDWLEHEVDPVVNLNLITYAGNRASLASVEGDPRYRPIHGSVTDRPLLDAATSIQTIEPPQGLKVACPEETAFQQGFIQRRELQALADVLGKSNCGDYLPRILTERVY